MKIEKRHIIQIVGWLLIVICFVGMYIAGRQGRKAVKCHNIEVTILDSMSNKFVNKNDIKGILDSLYGKHIGVSIENLNLSRIEKIIDNNSAVQKSQVYITKEGVLNIDITQRKPIIRFIIPDGGYYADAQGKIFPLQQNFSSRVHVVDGILPIPAKVEDAMKMTDARQIKWFKGIIALAKYMESNETWKDMFVQIHSLEDGSLILIPRKGQERFLFGQPDKIAEKFERISLYYTTIIPEKGEKHYSQINVAYEGQIICK